MVRSTINKSKYLLNKKRVSKRKKTILQGGEIIRYPHGDIYDGEVKHGKNMEHIPNGRGKYISPNGTIYEGDWNDGVRHGRGKQIWSDGSVYDGEWKDHQRHGRGRQNWSNGSVYDGEWKDDQRHGRGRQNWFNGDDYDGEWNNDNLTGKGKYTWSNSNIYEGDWKDFGRHGIGKMTWPNGTVYEGDWKDDKKHGRGNLSLPTDQFYAGGWEDDKKHGQGIWYLSGKSGYTMGEYRNDLEEGMHTHFSWDGEIIKYYYYNHGKIYTFENNIDKYIISEQIGNTPNRYITICMHLHGSDVINSICTLADNKHVRCISPVKCGQLNYGNINYVLDAFLIAYNISHLQHNNNASTYQKMMKIIEVYNQSNQNFYDLNDGAFSRPLIDHYYNAIDDTIKQIYIIDTNHMIDIFSDSYDLFTQKNAELKTFEDIEQYNILSKLITSLNLNWRGFFLRSNLINVLLDLGYDTINIIDFSCRSFNTDNLTNFYTSLPGKDYVCNYIENPDVKTQQGDAINSRKF